jgi:hypothetical protein
MVETDEAGQLRQQKTRFVGISLLAAQPVVRAGG